MTAIDWLLLAAYLVLTLVLGLWLARRNSGEADYFVAGRRLNGWLAGASMAATTFSIDTPLYVAGLVGARGLAGNWEWWSFGLAHVAMAVVFAPLWRRSGVLTDAAFTELRYGGAAAAWLRGIKAFLLAVPVNCIGIGYAFLALRKVVEALGLVSGQPAALGLTDTVWLLMVVALLVMSYTVAGGLWAVVVTDLVQLVLALAGALAVAAAALHAAGGMTALLEQIEREHAQYQAQVWQLDRQIDSIERNDRLIALTAAQQETLHRFRSPQDVESLRQIESRLAELSAIQEGTLLALAEQGQQHEYEARAQAAIGSPMVGSDPFDGFRLTTHQGALVETTSLD